MPGNEVSAPRCVAFVGPYLSGKTSLMEGCLHLCGAIPKPGAVKEKNTVGDASPEARDHAMSVEMSIAGGDYLGERWCFLDCPGSVEFAHEARAALSVADMAVVVCAPDPAQATAVAPILHHLDREAIPHLIFINKMDTAQNRVRDILEAFQAASLRPLALRHVPIREGDSVTGVIDVISERAYAYQEGQPSQLIELPESAQAREADARREFLETLADFDDGLLEQLLEDMTPTTQEIYGHLTRTLQRDRLVPVLLGAAVPGHGLTRLMKTLRHDGPDHAATLSRLGGPEGDPLALAFKTWHLPHIGKQSVVRILRGTLKDGEHLGEERISGLSRLMGRRMEKLKTATAGDVVALGRMETVRTGDCLVGGGASTADPGVPFPAAPKPVFLRAITPEKREDEVRLSAGLAKLTDEDPSLSVTHNADTRELTLNGQGDMHLRIALERLARVYNVAITARVPRVAYKETIRKPTTHHARHKKQSGGHGEFGDVHIAIRPQPRGAGFLFEEKIHGGSVPRQYIPAVNQGVEDYLAAGPLGFPVVDIAVTLTDGQHHAVDSSDMAFRKAAALAMREGMVNCRPILLEPIMQVTLSLPGTATAKAQAVLSRRRGQILGFDAREGWPGWEEIKANLPQAEIDDLIIELRSITQGVGSFDWEFDHLAELSGREADAVVAAQRGDAG